MERRAFKTVLSALLLCLLIGLPGRALEFYLPRYDHLLVLQRVGTEFDLTGYTGAFTEDAAGRVSLLRDKPAGFDEAIASRPLPLTFGLVNPQSREAIRVTAEQSGNQVYVSVTYLERLTVGNERTPSESAPPARPSGASEAAAATRPTGVIEKTSLISGSSVGLVPLTDLTWDDARDVEGGLYPGGKSVRPIAHTAAGLTEAEHVVPRDALGHRDPQGKIVLLSIGMSNTSQEFTVFQDIVGKDSTVSPQLVVVNGAQGSMTAQKIKDPLGADGGLKFWATVAERLKSQGVTAEQVQAVWLKQANAGPSRTFPYESIRLQEDLEAILHVLKAKFPHLRLVYLSSRIYAGYTDRPLNPEPFAYESGFSVKWLIEQQINGAPELNWDPNKGDVLAPWISWGPYLWADGLTPRSDGLIWEQADLSSDMTHPSDKGRLKVAQLLLEFFKTDETTRGWFLRSN